MATKQPIPIPELTQSEIDRFCSYVDRRGPDECWPWMGGSRDGSNVSEYGGFTIRHRVKLRAHRVAYLLHYGIEAIPYALHKCDQESCCNPAHLFAGTHKDNAIDRRQKGRNGNDGDKHWSRMFPEKRPRGDRNGSRLHPERHPRGERQGMAKLTNKQVDEIRTRFAAGEHNRCALGREFGVSNVTITNIVTGSQWKHLLPSPE